MVSTRIFRSLSLGAVMALAAVAASAAGTPGTIVGSSHDFSALNGGSYTCAACHAPHGGQTVAGAPLWSHASSTATYTMYSGTVKGTISPAPSGNSLLCLSCHDGTVAINNFGTNLGNNAGTKISAANLIGTDLTNDHPISVTYNTLLNPGLKPITNALTIGSTKTKVGTVESNMLFGAGKTVECASCHDVHNTYVGAGNFMLKVEAAALCTTCHDK